MKLFGYGIVAAFLLQLLLESFNVVEPMSKSFSLVVNLICFFVTSLAWIIYDVYGKISCGGIKERKEIGFGKGNWVGLICLVPVYVLIFSRMVD